MVSFGNPEIVKNKIMSYLDINDNEYNSFITSLKKYNAVIAGGFVLSCFSDFKSNDIDIYITNKNMKKFANHLPSYLSPTSLDFISKYDSIGKKYVMRMLCHKYDKNNDMNYNIKVDIVIIDDNYTIDEVIDNFDLSFCKIWFDGDKVYATYPKDIKKKTGFLNKKYINQYYNAVEKDYSDIDLICLRYKKYTSRGFKINIGKKPATIVLPKEDINVPILLSKKSTNENYIVKLLIQNFTNSTIIRYLINDIDYYSKYISKYINMFYYTEDYIERYYIEKITLFKYYFICLFNNFTFEEYIKNMNKLFRNLSIKYIYKSALYSLEEYLNSYYQLEIKYDYINNDIDFFTKHGNKSYSSKELMIIRFIIDNNLNKYEDYKFTALVDKSYIIDDYYKQYILKDKNIDINLIDSRQLKKILQIKKRCIKLITKSDIKSYLEKSTLTGFDLINCKSDINISKYLSENKEHIIIILVENDIPSITCISKKDLDYMISDIKDNWFYDCENMNNPEINSRDTDADIKYKEDLYLYNPIIKVPLSAGIFYFEYKYIYSLFMSKNKIFFVYPYYEIGSKKQKEIIKSASLKNTKYGIRKGLLDYLSANHCQDDSNIKLYEIRSLKLDTKKSVKTSFIKSISDESKSSSKVSSKSSSKPSSKSK
jgi:hypothetical protein